jgi:uncharacterized protein (TIGR02996 family)
MSRGGQDAGDALLRDIVEDPEDDAPRLVYADWLEDHGRPERAELIRAQIALASPPEGGAERRALRAREAELLEKHEEEWVGPLKQLGVRAGSLRRGLVEGVTLPARRFLEHGEQLLALAPVHSVKLTDARRALGELAKCPLLARLSGLDLSGNELQADDVRSLLSPHLSGLRRLDLSDNPIGPAGVKALAASPHLAGLRRLALRGVRMGFEGARALAGHVDYPQVYAKAVNLSGLVALDLRVNRIYEEGVTVLAHSPHLAGLTELSLSPIGGKSSEELEASRYLRNLTVLRISGPFSEGIPLLLYSRFLKRLRVLDLSETGATDEDAEEIAARRQLEQLEHLNLGNNHITDEGVQALARRARMPRLRRLDLSWNRITGAGAQALCGSRLVRELRELDLSGNQIDDAGAAALAGSALPGQLDELSLSDNPIGPKAAAALRKAAREAGLPRRKGNDFGVGPERSSREPFREDE